MLDAHFAKAIAKGRRYVQQGNNCVTPKELVAALNADGGIADCVAESIDYDREKACQLRAMTTKVVQNLSSIRSRINDVFLLVSDERRYCTKLRWQS